MTASNPFFDSSPTVVLPAQPPDQYFASSHYANGTTHGLTPSSYTYPFTPNESVPSTTPGSLAGRKRTRGDEHAPEDDDDPEDGSIQTPMSDAPAKPRGKPIYGPGMSLIYPEDPGYAAAAASQSGTWVEDRDTAFQLSYAQRPSVSTRKSQRKDGGASSISASDDLAQLVLPPQMREATIEPLIDEATRLLGISWTRMDSTEALRINQAAYAKWIQNHYPCLTNVSIWFENSALPGYLVAAQNAYSGLQEHYLFTDDLTGARLVTSEAAQLVPRLKMLPNIEVAAPGGCIVAERDPITAAQNEVDGAQQEAALAAAMTEGTSVVPEKRFSGLEWRPFAICSAHEMELD